MPFFLLSLIVMLPDFALQIAYDTQDPFAPFWVRLLDSVLPQALSFVQAVASAIGYHDLRAAREGGDIEAIASVFE